jgi:hypothetical protein
MKDNSLYYKPSGVAGIFWPVYVALYGFSTCIVAGFLYSYFLISLPEFVIFHCLGTGLFGLVVGLGVCFGADYGQIRSRFLMWFISSFFAVFACYVSWIFWIWISSEYKSIIITPTEIYEVMRTLLEQGTFKIGQVAFKGNSLIGAWVGEFLIIWFTVYLSGQVQAESAYCEKCNKWVTPTLKYEHRQTFKDNDKFIKYMEEGNFAKLYSLKKVGDDSKEYSNIYLSYCDSCSDSRFLRVDKVKHSKNYKGHKKTDDDIILDNLILSLEDFELIKSKLGKPDQED